MASTARRLSSSVPVEMRRQFGMPNAFRGRTTTPCDRRSSKIELASCSEASTVITKFASEGTTVNPASRRPSVSVRKPRAFNSSDRCRNSLSASAPMPGRLRRRGRLERQLDLEQIADQFLVREAVPDPHARQSVDLGKRAQRDHVVIAVVHRIRILRIVLGVLEVSFVENDQHALRHVPVKFVELLPGKDRPGRVVRIGQVDDLGVAG